MKAFENHTNCLLKSKGKVMFLLFNVLFTALSICSFAQDDTTVSDSELLLIKANPAILLDSILDEKERINIAEKLSAFYRDTATAKALPYDRVLINMAQSQKDTTQLQKYLHQYYRHENKICNYKAADSILKCMQPFVLAKNNQRMTADFYYLIASNYYDWSHYKKAALYYEKARVIYEHLQIKPGIAKCLKAEGAIWSNYSDFERSIGLLQRAQDLYSGMGDEQGLAASNNTLGAVMQAWGKLDMALEYFQKALKYYHAKGDVWHQINLLLHIGDISRLKKNYRSALKYFKRAEKLEPKIAHKKLESITYSNIGEVYYDMKRYDSALYYQKLALPLKYAIGDRRRIAISLLDIVKIEFKKQQYNTALKNAKKALKYSLQINANDLTMDIYNLFSKIYRAKKEYKKAYEYLKRYNRVHNLVFDMESNRLMSEMEVKFEAAKKDKENALLKKANTINLLKLNQEKESKFYLIALVSFFLFIALIIIYFINYRNRLIRKSYSFLDVKNKEITAQKESLAKLNEDLLINRERYRSIVENATIGMYQTTPEGKIMFANKTLLMMLGYSAEEIKKVNLNQEKEGREKFIALLESQEIITGREDLWLRADGSEMWVNESAWIIRNSKGVVAYYEGIVEDITKRKWAEKEAHSSRLQLETMNKTLLRINKEVEKARLEAEQANHAKSEFLANISHEIRTPLNSIVGFTDLLTKTVNDSLSLNYVRSIKMSSNSLLGLINDILDLSKIQAGKLELNYEPFFLTKLVEEIKQIFFPQVERKGIEFVVKTEIDKELSLFLDVVRIRQVLFNVIGNAIKFTDKGSVSVLVKTESCAIKENSYNLTFKVEDTGIGIPTEDLNCIFEAFSQSKISNGRIYIGTGLGLSITKKLLEIMGGTIVANSKINEGSRFLMNIPCVKAANSLGELKKGKTFDKNLDFLMAMENGKEEFKIPVPEKLNKQLASEFINHFSNTLASLQKNHLINEIVAFGEQLLAFAKTNALEKLEGFAAELLMAAHHFDIENVNYLLNYLVNYYNFDNHNK